MHSISRAQRWNPVVITPTQCMAEGFLWVGQHRGRKIHQIDPTSGAIIRTLESNRFVTGITWVDGELWHNTWEGDASDVRRVNFFAAAAQAERSEPYGVRKKLDPDSHRFVPLERSLEFGACDDHDYIT